MGEGANEKLCSWSSENAFLQHMQLDEWNQYRRVRQLRKMPKIVHSFMNVNVLVQWTHETALSTELGLFPLFGSGFVGTICHVIRSNHWVRFLSGKNWHFFCFWIGSGLTGLSGALTMNWNKIRLQSNQMILVGSPSLLTSSFFDTQYHTELN